MTSKAPHITVVGDLILDRYLIGEATKLNPEAPGVVIRVSREADRLGGATSVAMLAKSLGASVIVGGAIGRDEPGRAMLALIKAHGIHPHIWRSNRPTTWKQRIVTAGQLRPDRYDREVTRPLPQDASDFLASVPLGDALLVQDYGKGVCTKRLLAVLIERAHQLGLPILVDPARSRDWSVYGKVTLIKANWIEAKEAGTPATTNPIELAQSLAERHGCHVVVTLGKRGLVCSTCTGDTWHLPANPTTVRDACGAGDTVLATLGVTLSRGYTLRDACVHAVATATQQVSTLGISPVAFDERSSAA